MNRLGLVLTGGGARAAYQVGALSALSEIVPGAASPFATICGTSAGAINSAFLASRADHWKEAVTGLRELWHSLELEKIYRTDGLSLGRIATGWISRTLMGGTGGTRQAANYLLDTRPLRALLTRELDFEAIRKNIDAGILHALSLTATHYFAGMTVSFFEAHPSVEEWTRSNRVGVRTGIGTDHVMASSAIPVFFPPVEIGSGAYGDGCLRQTTPLSPAIHLGADRIVCIGIRHERHFEPVGTVSAQRAPHPSIAQIGGELMNALFLDSLESDVERMQKINHSLSGISEEARRDYFEEFRQIPILVLRPSRNLGRIRPNLLHRFPRVLRHLLKGLGATELDGSELVSYLAFETEFIDPVIELGFEDTWARREEIRNFLS